MAAKASSPPVKTHHLSRVLNQNPDTDWARINLYATQQIDALNWKGIGRAKADTVELLRQYQRLSRLLPESPREQRFEFMKRGIHSALQVAAMPRQQFIKTFGELFEHDEVSLNACHQRALAIRSQLLLQYMKAKQNQEPHIQSFNKQS